MLHEVITVKTKSELSIYEQIEQQMIDQILDGTTYLTYLNKRLLCFMSCEQSSLLFIHLESASFCVIITVKYPLRVVFEYSAPVEHPRPAKLNTCVA